MACAEAWAQSENRLTAYQEQYIVEDKSKDVTIDVINNVDFTAFQCDINIPDYIHFVTNSDGKYITRGSRLTDSHVVIEKLINDLQLRVIVYSTDNEAFSKEPSSLFIYSVAANNPNLDSSGNTIVNNIIFSQVDTSDPANVDCVEYKLDKGQLDFALVVRDFDLNKYNFIELPYKDTYGLICRSDNPLCKKKKITFDDMINEPIIVSRQSLAHDLRKWAGERVDELTIAATGDIPFNLSLLVKEGIGSLLCFDKIINTTETSNLRYIPLDPPMLSPLYIIWKKNAELTPPARKLMERFRYLKL